MPTLSGGGGRLLSKPPGGGGGILRILVPKIGLTGLRIGLAPDGKGVGNLGGAAAKRRGVNCCRRLTLIVPCTEGRGSTSCKYLSISRTIA